MTAEQPAPAAAFRPRWGLIGLIAAAVVILAVVAVIAVRLLLASPHPTLGDTDAADLQLGSCLREDEPDLDEYTVIDCSRDHPQQVVAEIDLAKTGVEYTHYESMAVYAQEVCDRYFEYGLFVREGTNSGYGFALLAMPDEDDFADGDSTRALCAIVHEDGDDLDEDLYQPMP